MADRIGPTFAKELEAAGLGGWPVSWTPEGEFLFSESLTPEQIAQVQAVFAVHDPTKKLVDVPQQVTRRQMLLGLVNAGFITSAEGIEAAKSGTMPAAVAAVVNTLPTQAEKDAAAITWASMSVCERSNSLVAALAAAQSLTSAQVDTLFINWSTL